QGSEIRVRLAYRQPPAIDSMLAFSARHSVAPVVEYFPMSKANDALERLRSGRARYRIVLINDFGKSRAAAESRRGKRAAGRAYSMSLISKIICLPQEAPHAFAKAIMELDNL